MENETYPIDARIERYLRSEMDATEQAAFEAEVDTNAELKTQLEVQLAAQGAIWAFGLEADKKELDALYEQASSTAKTVNMRSNIRMITVVAAAAAIVTLLLVFNPFQEATSAEGLYAAYYERPAAPEQLDVTVDQDSLIRMAHVHFNAKDNEKAAAIYEQLLYTDDTQAFDKASEAHRLLGICYLELNQPDKAIAEFKQVTAYTELADWYIALAYLKKGDTEAGKQQLTQIISDPKHFYRAKAEELLEEL